ncbi:MAG: hypothetical protein JO199_08770 [Candidatus Eremiobacteraeota bacterium]|nr:hypothetical protein [Candidatus Eremiobacteraeota bacterium]
MKRFAFAWVVTIALAGCSSRPSLPVLAPTSAGFERSPGIGAQSIADAYDFLDAMMDKYASGQSLRLVQSFDGGGAGNFTDAVTYDDALLVDALLARGTPDDLRRAEIIGNALGYVQTYDPKHDGRLRAAYAPKPLLTPADVVATDPTSDAGNMAWVGQALVQLYAKTRNAAFLKSAAAIALWLQANTRDTRGAGGYTGGYDAYGKKITWKSTEHNIDVYAFFTLLAAQSRNAVWSTRAKWAQRFVAAMWNGSQGRFYAGTGYDGVTPYAAFKPEDVNAWSYLAFQNAAWAPAPSWNVTNLAVTAGGFSGVSFCSGDRTGVWFEGTAHMADALKLRNGPGDAAQAGRYLNDVAYAQTHGLNGDGLGIVAASKNRLSDCDGDFYFASLHVGATAWYAMAADSVNPFKLLH